jgi:hypothetical protein
MMKCMRCKTGRVFIDRVFSQYDHLELYCMQCAKRWVFHKQGSKFAKWLMRKEAERAQAYGTFS